MNVEKLKETIRKEFNRIKDLPNAYEEDKQYIGQMDALEWVLEQFPEEHELLRNSC